MYALIGMNYEYNLTNGMLIVMIKQYLIRIIITIKIV